MAREHYRRGEETPPFRGYVELIATFGVAVAGLLLRHGLRGTLPDRLPIRDALMLGVATHKLATIVTQDLVTKPIRKPFVREERRPDDDELHETSRGRGLRKAIGDLLTCKYCAGTWVALALTAVYLESPRVGRTLNGIFAAVAVSDWLHRGYERLSEDDEESDASQRQPRPGERASAR